MKNSPTVYSSKSDRISARSNTNVHHQVAAAFWQSVNALRADGWLIRKYEKGDTGYISKDWFFGQKGDLKARIKADIKKRNWGNNYSFEIDFFEDITPCDNSNGGVYKYDRFDQMPYMLKLMTLKALNIVMGKVLNCGIELQDNSDPIGFKKKALNMDKINQRLCGSSHFNAELGHAEIGQPRNRTSGDDVLLEHGQVAYYIKNGRIIKGRAYYDLNNRWMLAHSKYGIEYCSSSDLYVNRNVVPGRAFNSREIDGIIQRQLQKAVGNHDYLRAHKLHNIINSEERFHIWSTKHGGGWWMVNGNGYTGQKSQAGLFKKPEAERLCKNDNELTMSEA